jgi:hypothetical protein
MDWVVQRVCEGGRKLSAHMRIAGRVRGRVTVEYKPDPTRNRTILVASLSTTETRDRIPPLYYVTLIRGTGECWTLVGFECITSVPLGHEHSVAQTWLLELAVVNELISAERRVNELSGEVHELREQLKAGMEAQNDASSAQS